MSTSGEHTRPAAGHSEAKVLHGGALTASDNFSTWAYLATAAFGIMFWGVVAVAL
jgi:hypothetical protein